MCGVRVVAEYPGGDHFLVLGEALRLDIHAENLGNDPLLYYRSAFSALPGDTRAAPAISGPPVPAYAATMNGHANGSEKRAERGERVDAGEDATARKRRLWFRDNSSR